MNISKITQLICILFVSSLSVTTQAHDHTEHHPSMVSTTSTDFDQMMREAMAKMHQDMEKATPTSDPDADFLRMMIPHHQGAVDAARAEILYGKNAETRRLAQSILTEQSVEIEYMRQILENRHKK